MIALPICSLAILITVLIIQIRNLARYMDGNGQEKTRILFIVQVVCLIIICICDIGRWPYVSYFPVLLLSFNSLAFYKGWNVLKPWQWIYKQFTK